MKKRTMIFVTAMVLLFAMVTGSTFAYMTSLTDKVTNTFTYGNVVIGLDEAAIVNGEKDDTLPRVMQNSYKVVPGATYDKDPTVHIAEKGEFGATQNSDNCYVFVKVENGFENYEADTNTIASQMGTYGWVALSGVANVFYYDKTASDDVVGTVVTAGTDLPVFTTLSISGDLTNDEAAAAANTSIVITAYAIQSEGFNSATAAWENASTNWTKS